jgi:hypothetical protein
MELGNFRSILATIAGSLLLIIGFLTRPNPPPLLPHCGRGCRAQRGG